MLLASTALALPGAALAQGVTLSGFAEMGVFDDDSKKGDGTKTGAQFQTGAQFHTDIDATIKMEGVTDTGITFGANVDIDELDRGGNAKGNLSGNPESYDITTSVNGATDDDADDGGATFYVRGFFGNVEMGDTDGGYDWAMEEIVGAGSIRDDHEHGGFDGNSGLDGTHDGQILRYDTGDLLGDFALGLSFEQDTAFDGIGDRTVGTLPGTAQRGDNTDNPADADKAFQKDRGDILGVGGKGSFAVGGATLAGGIGYQKDDWSDIVGGSFSAAFPVGTGSLKLVANYAQFDNDNGTTINAPAAADVLANATEIIAANKRLATFDDTEAKHSGIGATYSVGPLAFHANYAKKDVDGEPVVLTPATGSATVSGSTAYDVDGYGLAATYDLGGGASLQFGYGKTDYAVDPFPPVRAAGRAGGGLKAAPVLLVMFDGWSEGHLEAEGPPGGLRQLGVFIVRVSGVSIALPPSGEDLGTAAEVVACGEPDPGVVVERGILVVHAAPVRAERERPRGDGRADGNVLRVGERRAALHTVGLNTC